MTDPVERKMDEAARTLRDATSEPGEASAMTRARILASHRTAKSRGEQTSTWLLAAAALLIVLGGSTAWAYWTGRLAPLFGSPSESVEATLPAIPPEPAPRTPRPAPEPVSVSEVVPEAPVVPEIAEPEPVTVAEVTEPEAVGSVEAPSEPVDPAERQAYRDAHALHFEQHDDAAAIAAWDRYLASYPRGRFALEARYNRALCLVRSGQESEARAALLPFVEGTHGGYRQREAREIFEALDAP